MSFDPEPNQSIGIIAGTGIYPNLLIRRLAQKRCRVYVAAIEGHAGKSDDLSGVQWASFPVGALRQTIDYLKENGVERAFMAGGVGRKGLWRRLRPDSKGISLLPKALFGGDDDLLRRVAEIFEKSGVTIEDPSDLVADLLADEGHLSGPPLSAATRMGLTTAFSAAKIHGSRDRGQAAIAKGDEVLALEGREGTDNLLRGIKRRDACLAKVVKPGQDRRFDLPAIGRQTVEIAKSVGICAIGVESGGVLLLEKEKLIELVNDYGISLVGSSTGRF